MANRGPIQRERGDTEPVPVAAGGSGSMSGQVERKSSKAALPANDNPKLDHLVPCLPVTDEEVRLLHRYLSREILGLFA